MKVLKEIQINFNVNIQRKRKIFYYFSEEIKKVENEN